MIQRIFNFFKDRIYEHIIKPITFSVSPVNEAALGMAIGMFIGLTPTVGIQMWIVFVIWLFCRYILRIRFDLIIGTAVVWISNPFTMFFLYYGFLVTGLAFLSFLGIERIELSYEVFFSQFSKIVNSENSGFFDIVKESSKFLLIDLGYPMLLGSLFYAIPFSILSFMITRRLLSRYRIKKALDMGIDYGTWRKKFERGKKKNRYRV